MNGMIETTGIIVAGILSFAVSLALTWLFAQAVLRLMPKLLPAGPAPDGKPQLVYSREQKQKGKALRIIRGGK